MSSSNSNTVPVTPGCERGYLAPPTIAMIPADLPIVEQLHLAFKIMDAYLTYHCFVIYPSPLFILPAEYKELLKSLGPASDEHILVLQKSIRYCIVSESFFWKNNENPLAGIPYLTTESSNALRAVMSHWDCHSAMTRIMLELHDRLMEVEDLDFDPNPPPMNLSSICMLRCSSGPPAGSDDYIYHGSYIYSLERCFGYQRGHFVDYHSYRETGGVDGFLRSFGRERILPTLEAALDVLVATYKAHPIHQFENIFYRLGAPRYNYTLNPPPISEEATKADEAVIDFWVPIVKLFEDYDICMRTNVVETLRVTAEAIPTLKEDAEASYYLNVLARMAPNNRIICIDLARLITSFNARRLPENAPELQIRPRQSFYTTAAIDTLGIQTQAMVFNCV
jgi:hypothetical protein